MEQGTEGAVAELEARGHRVTGSRRAVVDAIVTMNAPFTVEEVCGATPGVGRATVFRTVKLLQELDLVCRLPLGDGSVRYQLSRSEHHHHLVCSSCGAVNEFSDADLDARIGRNAREAGFLLDGHSLELYGRCRNCQSRG